MPHVLSLQKHSNLNLNLASIRNNATTDFKLLLLSENGNTETKNDNV